MLIKDKDITSYIPIAVNKTRSCACKLKYLLLWPVNLFLFFVFFFSLFEKMGWSGDGKRNLLLGWPYEPLGLEILGLSRELNFGFTNCCSNEGNMTNIWNEAVNSTKSFTAKFVGSPARFAIRKKRVFLFRQSFRRLLRKHMFTLRVQKVMICDFRSVWFASVL